MHKLAVLCMCLVVVFNYRRFELWGGRKLLYPLPPTCCGHLVVPDSVKRHRYKYIPVISGWVVDRALPLVVVARAANTLPGMQ